MENKFTYKTKLYGVIGDPIGHSLSPRFQNYFISKKNLDALYLPFRIPSHDLKDSIGLLKNNFSGFNITIPHKEAIMGYLDEIDPLALDYGAVNTVKVVKGRLYGYNTDGFGFVKSLDKLNIHIGGKNILLIGAGGAARVIGLEVIRNGGNLTISNRNIERAYEIRESGEKVFGKTINIAELHELRPPYNIIINSTPLGMYPNIDQSPIGLDILEGADLIYDIIYNPLESKLLKMGRKKNIKTINGLAMLIYQGLRSFEIWTGIRSRGEEEEEIYKLLEKTIN